MIKMIVVNVSLGHKNAIKTTIIRLVCMDMRGLHPYVVQCQQRLETYQSHAFASAYGKTTDIFLDRASMLLG